MTVTVPVPVPVPTTDYCLSVLVVPFCPKYLDKTLQNNGSHGRASIKLLEIYEKARRKIVKDVR